MKPLSLKAAIYLRAAELVEMGHCKDAFARDAVGHALPGLEGALSEAARSYCGAGAIARAAWEFSEEDPRRYWPKDAYDFGRFNDDPHTTAAEVAARLREEAFKE